MRCNGSLGGGGVLSSWKQSLRVSKNTLHCAKQHANARGVCGHAKYVNTYEMMRPLNYKRQLHQIKRSSKQKYLI